MRRLGVPVVYYVSPQLWAWRPGRMRTMKRIADRVLVIFPFEEEIYTRAGVPVEFVGHPLLELTDPPEPRASFLTRVGLDPSRQVVALLPGSRVNEVRAILPGLFDAARILHDKMPGLQFVLARAPHVDDSLIGSIVGGQPSVTIVSNVADQVLASADVALVASGTVTVQAALRECPMVVVYRLSPLTYRLGRPFVSVDTFAMANLVAGRKVVPELMQDDFTPMAVADHALALLQDRQRADEMRAGLRTVKARLGSVGASQRAAEAILTIARQGSVDRLG
jgi:lipid-A-disaccharide synthase